MIRPRINFTQSVRDKIAILLQQNPIKKPTNRVWSAFITATENKKMANSGVHAP